MGNFIKPSVVEVASYCLERKNGIDAEQFYAHYESNGWKVGKVPMKNWKFAVITWEKNSKTEPRKPDAIVKANDEWGKWKEERDKARREGKLATEEDYAVLRAKLKDTMAQVKARALMFSGRGNDGPRKVGDVERVESDAKAAQSRPQDALRQRASVGR